MRDHGIRLLEKGRQRLRRLAPHKVGQGLDILVFHNLGDIYRFTMSAMFYMLWYAPGWEDVTAQAAATNVELTSVLPAKGRFTRSAPSYLQSDGNDNGIQQRHKRARKRAGIDRGERSRRTSGLGSASMRSLRQVEKQDPENQIDGQKLHALKPIRFPVAVDLKNQMHGDNHRHDLRQCELQIHRLAEKIREKDEHRSDKKRDL
jgi:hypothetical protein